MSANKVRKLVGEAALWIVRSFRPSGFSARTLEVFPGHLMRTLEYRARPIFLWYV